MPPLQVGTFQFYTYWNSNHAFLPLTGLAQNCLLGIKAILVPFQWVIRNIFPYSRIIIISADNVIMETFLPYALSKPQRNCPLKLANNIRNRRRLSRSDSKQQMNMVRHNSVLVYKNRRIYFRYCQNTFVDHQASLGKLWLPISQFVCRPENLLFILCTDSYKIKARRTIIKKWQTVFLSFGQFHVQRSHQF